MALYKERGFNPMAGCWPLLAQMPFFFALYQVIYAQQIAGGPNVLIGKTFFGVPLQQHWLQLAGWDKIFSAAGITILILTTVMSLTTYISQRQLMSKQTAQVNPQQQTIMKIMPLMFFVFAVNVPLAVIIYWVTTNFWSVGQQYMLLRSAPAPACGRGRRGGSARGGRRRGRKRRGPQGHPRPAELVPWAVAAAGDRGAVPGRQQEREPERQGRWKRQGRWERQGHRRQGSAQAGWIGGQGSRPGKAWAAWPSGHQRQPEVGQPLVRKGQVEWPTPRQALGRSKRRSPPLPPSSVSIQTRSTSRSSRTRFHRPSASSAAPPESGSPPAPPPTPPRPPRVPGVPRVGVGGHGFGRVGGDRPGPIASPVRGPLDPGPSVPGRPPTADPPVPGPRPACPLHSPKHPVLDPAAPQSGPDSELDQDAQPAQAAASTAPADLTQTSDPTDTSSGTASTPDPGAGIPSAPQASDQVPTTASGPHRAGAGLLPSWRTLGTGRATNPGCRGWRPAASRRCRTRRAAFGIDLGRGRPSIVHRHASNRPGRDHDRKVRERRRALGDHGTLERHQAVTAHLPR